MVCLLEALSLFLDSIPLLSACYAVCKRGRLVWITFDAMQPLCPRASSKKHGAWANEARLFGQSALPLQAFHFLSHFKDQLNQRLVIGSRLCFLSCWWFPRECQLHHGFKDKTVQSMEADSSEPRHKDGRSEETVGLWVGVWRSELAGCSGALPEARCLLYLQRPARRS